MKDSISDFLQVAARAEYIAVDTEASIGDYRYGDTYCMGVSVTYKIADVPISEYIPFKHPDCENWGWEYLDQLKDLISKSIVIFHNAKFDIRILETLGIEVNRFYDTMIMAHMVNENWESKELDWLSEKLLKDRKDNFEVDRWKVVLGWENIPYEIMKPYACHDTELTLALFEIFLPELRKQEMLHLWEPEAKFLRMLMEMERIGILIDPDFCQKMIDEGDDAMSMIICVLGWDPGKPTQLAQYFFDELHFPVLEFTKGGRPSFDKKVMEKYDELLEERNDPTASLVLQYRGWSKAVSSGYRAYLNTRSVDGRVRTDFVQHGTETGRLSSRKPNLQQIPRTTPKPWNGRMKNCFIPTEGYKLWGLDYKQLELRLAAAYAKEEKMLQIFEEDRDYFAEGAIEVFGTVDKRYEFKTLSYMIEYGSGGLKIGKTWGFPILVDDKGKEYCPEGLALKRKYFETYPKIETCINAATNSARKNKYVRYWTGRRRHIPYKEFAYKAFNAVMQGGAAEIVKRAMINCQPFLSDDVRLLLQVHDELVFEIREGFESVIPDLKKAMIAFPQFGVKLDVDVHKWGE